MTLNPKPSSLTFQRDTAAWPPVHIDDAGVGAGGEKVSRAGQGGAADAALVHGAAYAPVHPQVPRVHDAVAACGGPARDEGLGL